MSNEHEFEVRIQSLPDLVRLKLTQPHEMGFLKVVMDIEAHHVLEPRDVHFTGQHQHNSFPVGRGNLPKVPEKNSKMEREVRYIF